MIINRDITLDVSDNSLTVKVFAKRLDDMKRHLTATIVNGSTPINIPTTTNVIFQGTKPDSKGFMYDCTVNANGTVDVEICAEVLAVAGIVRCELEMTDTSGVITTATFKLNVEEKALSPDVVKSKDEFKSLYSMLLECRGYTESIINDAEHCSQKADEAKYWAQLADDVVNCVPLNYVEDNFTTTTAQHVLSASAGKTLNDTKVDKVAGKGLSTHDLTNELKIKLDGIEKNAKNTPVVDSVKSTSATSALSANQGKLLNDENTTIAFRTTELEKRKEIFYGETSLGKTGDVQFKTDGTINVYDGTTWGQFSPKLKPTRTFGKITYKSGVTNQTNASGVIKDENTGLCIMTLACTLKASGETWETIGYLPSDFYPYDYDPTKPSSGSNGGAIGSVVITDGGSSITGAELSIGDSGKIQFKSAGTTGSRWIVGSVTYFCAV